MTHTHRPEHFQQLYDDNPDPWGFRTSAYERAKYDRTLAALCGQRFRRGFEAGCSIGVLTARLAERCDALLAVDFVAAPLATARETCARMPWVQFAQMDITETWPDGRFDLIVLSEVLYFMAPPAIAAVARRVADSLKPDGLAVLVNWHGQGSDDPVSGGEAARLFIAAAPRLAVTAADLQPGYRIDRLRHRDPRSACAGG